jgi:hypothetical protein
VRPRDGCNRWHRTRRWLPAATPGLNNCLHDPTDDPNVSKAGSPHARYAVVRRSNDMITAELIAVEYDHRAAAARAAQLGGLDWAHALVTGYALPLPGMT